MRIEIEDEVVVFDDADSAVYTDEVPEDAIIEDGVSSDSIDTGETLIVNLGGKVNEVLVNGESVVADKVARITLSKVGQTNDYNDLDNKPDVDAIKDDLNKTKEQLDLVTKGQTSDSLAIVGLQSDMLTAKEDIAGLKTQVEENTELLDQVNKGHTADSLAIVGLQSDVLTLKADVSDLQDQIAESGGTTVKVGGVAVDEFNADSKADASTVEQLETTVEGLGNDVSQQGSKIGEVDKQLVNLATQVATDYYNKTDADGKFATKDQMASQDNTTLQSANSYTDTKIADLVDAAPETLDTLGEVAKAIKDNQDVVNALNSAIGNKVDKTVKINGHPLTQNIVLTAEDVGALSDIPDGYVTTDTLNSAMEKKVDKVDGKGLSTNDFTNADKSKLDMLMNYDDTSLDTRVSSLENTKANAIDLADVIDNKTAIGSDSRGTKLGYGSIATDVTSIAIGNRATTSRENDVAIGHGTIVAGKYSVGIGQGVVINTAALESVALGVSAKVGDGDVIENAVQIGRGTNTQSNTLQIFSDNIYNHETHTMDVQNLVADTAQVGGANVLTENAVITKTFVCQNPKVYSGSFSTSGNSLFSVGMIINKIGTTRTDLQAKGVKILWVTVMVYQYSTGTSQFTAHTNHWSSSDVMYTQLSTNARSNGNTFVIPMYVDDLTDYLLIKALTGSASTAGVYVMTVSYSYNETLDEFNW